MNLAVIPARGGSKRIKRKNVRDFAGAPMISWSIAAAKASGLFGHILVSTDDPEIAQVAVANGAEAPFLRPAELSDDHSGTAEVITHAASWAHEAGWGFDSVCCIYATAPFVAPESLREAQARLDSGSWDFVFAAVRYSHPVQRGFGRSKTGAMELMFPEHRLTRTQDLPPVYHDAGQFYWGRRDAWLSGRPIFGDRSTFIELPPWQAQDIDTSEDWTMAEFLFEIMKRKNGEQ